MRICIIYLGRRGSGGLISLELAKSLSKVAEIIPFVSCYAESLPAWKASGVDYVQVDTFHGPTQALWSWIDRRAIQSLAEKIRRVSPDILLFPMLHPWNPLLQGLLHEIPSLVFVHDPQPHPGPVSWLQARIEDLSIRRAAGCVVLSRSGIPALLRRGACIDRITVVPHGPISYHRMSSPEPKPNGGNRPTILFFGRITPYKGIQTLLDAFRQISDRLPEACLLLVGEGDLGPYRAAVAGVRNIEIVNRWIRENEVPGFFQRADLVVLPYTSASQSGVIPLAASYRLPIVATRVGGIPEQVVDGETAVLVEPGSAQALADAILMLLRDPRFAETLGERLHLDYGQNKTWDVIAQTLFNTCLKTTGQKLIRPEESDALL